MHTCTNLGEKSGNAPFFSRNMSQMVKGIAILMMLSFHCFAFPDYWLDDFQPIPFLMMPIKQFKLCVGIFAFITGYGFYIGRHGTYRNAIRKTLVFLSQYWLQLFLIFLPIASVSFHFSVKKILYNMVALNDNIVYFAWYVFFHCFVTLTFPFVRKLLAGSAVQDLAIVLVGGYCATVFFYFLPLEGPLFSMLIDCAIFYPVVGMGYLAAKYGFFDRIGPRIHIPGAIILILAVIFLRMQISVVKGFTIDVFYAPLFICTLCVLLRSCRAIHPLMSFLGKYSFHMWLFHSIFFSPYTRMAIQPLVNWSDLALVRFLLVTALSAVAAVLIDKVWKVCSTAFVSD